MESTIKKLNQNKLMELEEKDFDNLLNNSELLSLFLQKLTQGYRCNAEYLYKLEEILFSAQYIGIVLETFKEQLVDDYVSLFFSAEEEIRSQFPEDTAKAAIAHLEENYDFVINYLRNSKQQTSVIKNSKLINLIISNKLEQHYGSIEMNPLTAEFEQLLIDALERNNYTRIYSISLAILKKCKETDNLDAATYGISGQNPEEDEFILEALNNGQIEYERINYQIKDRHKRDVRVMRALLRSQEHKYIEKEEFKRPEVRQLIIEEIKRNNELANEWFISNGSEEYPDLVVTIVKYCSPRKTNDFFKYNENFLTKTIQTNKKELIEALIYNIEHNLDNLEELFTTLLSPSVWKQEITKGILEDPTFFKYIVPKLKIEDIFNVFLNSEYIDGEKEYFIEPNIYELLSSTDITFTEVPKNFNYQVDYPTNIWLRIIPILNETQLTPSNISLDRFTEKPEIFDCILLRLKELKSNSYNSYLEYYWKGEITQTLIDVVCDPTNPLNLNTSQKLRILPTSKINNTKHVVDILSQLEVVDYATLQMIVPITTGLNNLEEVKKIWDLTFSKLELEENAIRLLSSHSADIYETIKNNPENHNIPKQQLILYNCLKDFIKTQKGIPLTLTRNFDEEIIESCTYSCIECLTTNPELFLVSGRAPHHFVEYIQRCQQQGLPIDLKLIDKAAKTNVSSKFYNYENITFSNDKETYSILYELLNLAEHDSPKRKIVTKWINTGLDYKFFEYQPNNDRKQLMELVVLQEDYIEKILEIINSNNLSDSITLDPMLFELLVNSIIEDPSKQDLVNKIYETIMQLISDKKIGTHIPEITLLACLNYVNHPTFIEFIKENIIKNIVNHLKNIEYFLENSNYKEATLNVLYENKNIANNDYIINLVHKYPELKQYVKKFLEQDQSNWTEFKERYFDIDLLPAYLKNHSIDKVITFIVHSQKLSLITPDLYQIIKNSFLKAHQEYNKESFDILEQFYGLELLLLLEADNLKILLSKDKDVVKKFTEIFKERQLDESIISSISDSFRQNYFNIENAHIINFYTNTLEKIQRGITEEEIQEVINTLANYIPEKLEEEIKATGNELLLNTYKSNKLDFLTMLIHELINNQNMYVGVFNKITNNFIVQKRNEYRKTQNIYIDTNLKYELETKSLYNALFNYLAKNEPNKLINMLGRALQDTNLNIKTIFFLSGQSNEYSEEEIPSIKRNIPQVKAIIFKAIERMNDRDKETKKKSTWSWYTDEQPPKKFSNLPRRFEYLLDIPEFNRLVKKIPIYPPKQKAFEKIGNINITVFEQLTKDKEKYQTLLDLLNKYRFLEWGNLFNPTIDKLSLGNGDINLYNFINAFSKIYDNEKKIILRERKRLIDIVVEEMKQSGKTEEDIDEYIRLKEKEPINVQITAYKVLKYSTIYSSIANYYKIILGMEDFDLVKRNDGPNSAHRSAEDRLEKATEMQLKLIELDQVTVPSFIYEHELKGEEKKKLAVTVGNRADSRNLTHGERTGACMRAYGFADSLFDFCNTDPRGFHITFTDPDTNEYVSRVSCFRNGNTVFLNQLRNSVSSNYTTEDVIEACFAVAKELIERSKDSDMPIENVVASTGYALSGYQTQQLSEYNIGEGVYTGYKDVNHFAVVIATTGENGKAVPLKLDGENQPIYKPVRLKPREYISPNITDSIKVQLQRITSIKECLIQKDTPDYYKTIDFDYELIDTEYLHVIIGQDWYVALDINGNLTHDIAVQNEHSINELNEAIAKMSTIKETKLKTGGFTNGI